MKFRIYYIIVLILFISCGDKRPDYPLEEPELVEILTDMLIADELLVKYGGNKKEYYKDSLKMYILRKYNLVEPEFDAMMLELQSDLKYYHSIQKKVGDGLINFKNVEDTQKKE